MTDCLFCKIASGEMSTDLVYEDDELVAFRDIKLLFEQVETEFDRPDAVKRRQMPHECKIVPIETRRLLDRHNIGRRFNYADERRITR